MLIFFVEVALLPTPVPIAVNEIVFTPPVWYICEGGFSNVLVTPSPKSHKYELAFTELFIK